MTYTVAAVDIETSGLKGNMDFMLCCCIKPVGGEMETYRIDDRRFKARISNEDRLLVMAVRDRLQELDLLCGHNIIRFDLRFMRTRLNFWDEELLGPKMVVDTLPLARKNLAMTSNRMETLAEFYHLPISKTRLEPELWEQARHWREGAAQHEALGYIVDHCYKDVEIQEQLLEHMSGLIKQIPRVY